MLYRISAIFCTAGILVTAGAWPSLAAGWQHLATRYLDIYYLTRADLETFDRRIQPVKHLGRFSGYLPARPVPGEFSRLAQKADSLVEKVQLILGMHGPIRIRVRIYPGEKALEQAYFHLYRNHRKVRAWYLYAQNTIYLNVQELFSGMLAHEVAHAVIDHYLGVRPPRATAEILARYVDAHLNKAL